MPKLIPVDAEIFYSEFKRCVDNRLIKFYECVLVRDLSYYKSNCKLFIMSEHLDAGAALERDGRIISVFKCENAVDGHGLGQKIINRLIEEGGNRLECNFVKKLLLGVYYRLGFVPVTTAPLSKDDIYWEALNNEEKYPKRPETGNAVNMMYCFYSTRLSMLPICESVINLNKVKRFETEDIADQERDKIMNDVRNGNSYGYINSIVGFKLYS